MAENHIYNETNMKKFDNTFIVSVDGVDGAGKSTFISNLKNNLEEVLDTNEVDITIQHFPNYDIDSGKDIKFMLMTCKDAFDPHFISSLTDLNMLNRYQTICDYKPDTDKKFHIILLDRYKSSNDFFNIMKYKYHANDVIDESRNEYKDIILAHLIEMNNYCTPEPDLQIFATIDEGLQLERLSKKKEKDTFEIADNIRFVNKLFAKYIDLRLPIKYKGNNLYPLFFERYRNNHISIDDQDYSLETDMESILSERCMIDDKHEALNYYDPDNQSIEKFKFKGKKEFFPFFNKELNKFLYGNILILPMEVFDESYIENNFKSIFIKYPSLICCKSDCIPELMIADKNKEFSIKKCKTKCIPKMVMNRVVDIILMNMNIPKQ